MCWVILLVSVAKAAPAEVSASAEVSAAEAASTEVSAPGKTTAAEAAAAKPAAPDQSRRQRRRRRLLAGGNRRNHLQRGDGGHHRALWADGAGACGPTTHPGDGTTTKSAGIPPEEPPSLRSGGTKHHSASDPARTIPNPLPESESPARTTTITGSFVPEIKAFSWNSR